jgi:hypothetical protein
MPNFISGLELGAQFFSDLVRPVMASEFPGLRFSAGLIGEGSEVLGFDDPMSRDHDWGPRCMLFLEEEDYERLGDRIDDIYGRCLPREYGGYSTEIGRRAARDGEVNHRIEVGTVRRYIDAYLGFDIDGPLEPADWLTFSEQKLRALTAGAVFHDECGLEEVRGRFTYYPRDVWLYLLAAGWNRIGQEEHLMGRAGYVGDEIGSALIGARLVRDVMRLAFLMERQYAPYPKWFGTAFAKLPNASRLLPALQAATVSETWREREANLTAACSALAQMHNDLRLTRPLPTHPSHFFDRPFKVIHLGGGFAEALVERIEDPQVRKLASNGLIGGIDQISDNTDLLTDPVWRTRLRRLYE